MNIKTLFVMVGLLAGINYPTCGWAAVTRDADGWTVVTPSADSRVIYVSSSDGNDADNGLSAANAKATLAAGLALLRAGFPDHLLLKRGDSFTGQSITPPSDGGGRSVNEPWYFGSYGTGARPRIDSGDNHGIQLYACNYVVIAGLHLEPTRSGNNGTVGIMLFGGNQWTPSYHDILIEDNFIRGYGNNVSLNGIGNANSTVRRNIIVDSWNRDSVAHAQGIYSASVDGLLIEENFFDHNGWHDKIPGAHATIFNHNMYLSHGNRNVTIRNNVSSRGSSMGLKFQPVDGTHSITGNLFIRNGYAAQIGGGAASSQAGQPGAEILANDNIFIEGEWHATQSTGLGVTVSNVRGGSFSNNIIANKLSTTGQFALSLQDGMGWESIGVGVRNFAIEGNIVYNWRGPVLLVQPTQSYQGGPVPVMQNIAFLNNAFQEPDPAYASRLIETYSAAAGVATFTGGRYFRDMNDANNTMRIGTTNQSLVTWETNTGETTASPETQIAYADPSRGGDRYADSLSAGGTWLSFLTMVKQQQQPRTMDNPVLRAATINAYIRAGFQPASGLPTVTFAAAASSGSETVTAVNLTVNLSVASGQTVTVNYAVTGGTATGGGTDYTLAAGVATFTPGQTSRAIPVTIVNDTLDEPDETLIVTLSSPNNAVLGANVTHTYTINDNDPPPNQPPAITSGPTATPNPAVVDEKVQFSVTASDPDGDSLTYTWDFGDGIKDNGAAILHSYSAAGVYTVTVEVSDSQAHVTGGPFTVTITAPPSPPPPATTGGGDGDGGSPTDGGSAGGGGGGGTAPKPFTVTKLLGKVRFTAGGKDGVQLSGVLPELPAGFTANGATVTLDVGGAAAEFTLNAKGAAKTAQGTFALLKPRGKKKNAAAAGGTAFKATLRNGAWADEWADEDMARAGASTATVRVTLDLSGTLYAADVPVKCSAKNGAGKFRK